MADSQNVEVDADNDLGFWLFLIVFVVATWGDPDLLDVLERWCRIYLETHP